MQEAVADLEPQTDASESSETGYVDRSIDTSIAPEPVEAESEVKEVEPEIEADSSPAEVEVLEEKADPPDPDAEFGEKVKKRIDEVTGKWRESDRKLTARDLEIEDLRAKLQAVPQPAEEPFKTLADFEYDEGKYQAYMATEIPRRATVATEQAMQGYESQEQAKVIDEKFAESEAEFAKTVEDYKDVVYDPSLRISPAMANVFKDNAAPELAYFLGNNPDIASDLSALSPEDAGFKMGIQFAELQAAKAAAKPKKVTKAPPPAPKIKAGDAGMTKDPADMSDSEFRKWREKQIASR